MQRTAADNAAGVFQHHKISDVFAELGQCPRQQRAVVGVSGNPIVNLLGVGQDCFKRAHGPPHEESRFSFEWR
jgi:hypothetical protein